MTEIIGAYGGYRRTLSFGFACLIYHATEVFCERNYSYKNDALGKTVGQMLGAARSARQNIVEGSSRAGTSKETELRLYDVAKGSLEELAGDYEAFLIGRGEAPWAANDPRASRLMSLALDRYTGALDRHDYGEYILSMRKRFAAFLEADGFTERMSKARLETRDAQVAAAGAPNCPKCGKPMRKVIARKGRNAGNPFWACTGYPDCNGTRNFTAKG